MRAGSSLTADQDTMEPEQLLSVVKREPETGMPEIMLLLEKNR